MDILLLLGAVSVLVWLGILLHPARPWDFQPVGEDEPADFEVAQSDRWPSVWVLVPARNEAKVLPHTLPALLQQDYPGQLTVLVIDDRSDDASGEIARQAGHRLDAPHRLVVLSGAPLPPGWVGKVWALEQGAAACGLGSPGTEEILHPQRRYSLPRPDYVLLTDADIHHAPRSVWRLVAESEREGLALNSRMARLRCVSGAERLLIPPFVFFFSLLYPRRWVNNSRRRVAAAAGGCVLLTAAGLEKIGGFASIKGKLIDDVNLALRVKRFPLAVRLSLSRTEVTSLRVYDELHTIWTMVRRTAFTELGYSALRLLGTLAGLGLLFVLPPLWCVGGLGVALWGGADTGSLLLSLEGSAALVLSAIVYWPAIRFFELPYCWVWTLPLAGSLYGAMTVDSALRYWTGRRLGWRDN